MSRCLLYQRYQKFKCQIYQKYLYLLDGYLAKLQKSHVKPVIKTYTIKDYRNFKKDAMPISTSSTGKLGFDFESDHYKHKVILLKII